MKYSMKKANENSMGYRLRTTRKNLGLTALELSKKTGVNRTTIAKLETGANKNVHASTACLIANALGVTTDWLVLGSD